MNCIACNTEIRPGDFTPDGPRQTAGGPVCGPECGMELGSILEIVQGMHTLQYKLSNLFHLLRFDGDWTGRLMVQVRNVRDLEQVPGGVRFEFERRDEFAGRACKEFAGVIFFCCIRTMEKIPWSELVS